MAQYLFILGRNPELSILELQSIFGDFDFKRNSNAILAELPKFDNNFIDRLGGVIAIGEVLADESDFNKKINDANLYLTSGNKLNYILWDFSNNNDNFYEEARSYLKGKFKEERIKATEKKISNRLKLQSGKEVVNLSSKKLIDEQYFVFDDSFGRIIQTTDYEELERSDMEKPVRREELSISPRLAKIMINLSGVQPGQAIVDSFCGIGVIVQEALRQKMNVIGIDKDAKAIDGLKKNLEWLKVKNNYQLINKDSSIAKIPKVNALVTEPDLGEVHKTFPNEETATSQLRQFESLMIKVLNNIKENVSGKFVFTAPFILATSKGKIKRIGCSIERIVGSTRLKLVQGFPIEEFREGQIVGRQIIVLKK